MTIAADLDAACPGHLLAAIHGGDLIRHVKFLTYAEISEHGVDAVAARLIAAGFWLGEAGRDALTLVARALSSLRPREIVAAVLGSVPEGYLGLLGRLGPDPLLKPSLYRAAWSLYADPRNRRRASLLRHIQGRVTPTNIEAAAHLPDVLRRTAVLEKIHDVAVQLPSLTAFLNYIRVVCDADDATITHSLNDLKSGASGQDLKSWAQAWMLRQVRLHVPPPIPAEDTTFSLILGKDLVRIGREYRNCLGNCVTEAFLASSVYYLWEGTPGGAIIALNPLSHGGWFVEDAKLARNRKLPASAMRSLQAALGKYDIAIHLLSPEGSPSPCPLNYILDSWPYGLSFDEEDDGAKQEEDEPDLTVQRHLDRFLAGINGEPVPDGYYEDETETA